MHQEHVEYNGRSLMASAKFFEGYSRYNNELDRYETWYESVDRIMDMHVRKYADVMSDELMCRVNAARRLYYDKRVLGSQRALQFGGDQILKHELKMYNCLSSYMDRPAFFGEVFYSLLCGSGVGFSAQRHHVARLPMIRPRTKQAKTHVVADSIEGWAEALDVLMSSFFMGGGMHPEYEGRKVYFDFNEVREKGSSISGGFIAPGPDGLMQSMNRIERLLTGIAEEGVIRPIDGYDIVMHAADAVLSGGVRRAATSCLFSEDDEDMMTAKVGAWMHRNPQRARSNNSMVLLREQVTDERLKGYVDKIREFGEPGIVILNSQEHTLNPCFEICMYPQIDGVSGFQGCNLTEINGAACTTSREFYEACEAAAVLGTLQAGYTDFKFLDNTSKRIFEREALLGVSVTGWMNSPKVLLVPEVQREGARLVRRINGEIAKLIGINPAARLTTVKPSGNASVLLGTTSGLNGEHAPRYIRNVQLTKGEPVSEVLRSTNPYMVEDSVWSANDTDYVVSFPVVAPADSIFKSECTGVNLLKHVLNVQKNWIASGTVPERCADEGITHNVSNTIIVRDDEWDDVTDYIYANREYFCGIAFISDTGDRDYNQAPFVAIPTTESVVARYGRAALFASGLIVDVYQGFPNLWVACDVAVRGFDVSAENADQGADWIRRFGKFADNYFDGDLRETEMLLKDVFLLHRWSKIQSNMVEFDFEEELSGYRTNGVEIDTLAAQSCYGGACEL